MPRNSAFGPDSVADSDDSLTPKKKKKRKGHRHHDDAGVDNDAQVMPTFSDIGVNTESEQFWHDYVQVQTAEPGPDPPILSLQETRDWRDPATFREFHLQRIKELRQVRPTNKPERALRMTRVISQARGEGEDDLLILRIGRVDGDAVALKRISRTELLNIGRALCAHRDKHFDPHSVKKALWIDISCFTKADVEAIKKAFGMAIFPTLDREQTYQFHGYQATVLIQAYEEDAPPATTLLFMFPRVTLTMRRELPRRLAFAVLHRYMFKNGGGYLPSYSWVTLNLLDKLIGETCASIVSNVVRDAFEISNRPAIATTDSRENELLLGDISKMRGRAVRMRLSLWCVR
jgi:Mg2+ and Co2+ transporter CorA